MIHISNQQKSGMYTCKMSETDEDEHDDAQKRFEEERRLSRLYGSNARRSGTVLRRKKKESSSNKLNVAKGDNTSRRFASCNPKNKQNEGGLPPPPNTISRQEQLAKPRTRVEKFIDNKNICKQKQAWHVGYINATTLPAGSPFAHASRYGPDGALNLKIQCADRVTRVAGNLESIIRGSGNTTTAACTLANEWTEPLIASPHGVTCGKLGGGGNFASTPKMWDQRHTAASRGDYRPPTLPPRLQKMVEKDTNIWNGIATDAKEERKERARIAGGKRGEGRRGQRRSTTAISRQRNHMGLKRSNPSMQKVFSLR